MGQALTNITKELQTQENIDKEIMARLDALESALKWVDKRFEAKELIYPWTVIRNISIIPHVPLLFHGMTRNRIGRQLKTTSKRPLINICNRIYSHFALN